MFSPRFIKDSAALLAACCALVLASTPAARAVEKGYVRVTLAGGRKTVGRLLERDDKHLTVEVTAGELLVAVSYSAAEIEAVEETAAPEESAIAAEHSSVMAAFAEKNITAERLREHLRKLSGRPGFRTAEIDTAAALLEMEPGDAAAEAVLNNDDSPGVKRDAAGEEHPDIRRPADYHPGFRVLVAPDGQRYYYIDPESTLYRTGLAFNYYSPVYGSPVLYSRGAVDAGFSTASASEGFYGFPMYAAYGAQRPTGMTTPAWGVLSPGLRYDGSNGSWRFSSGAPSPWDYSWNFGWSGEAGNGNFMVDWFGSSGLGCDEYGPFSRTNSGVGIGYSSTGAHHALDLYFFSTNSNARR